MNGANLVIKIQFFTDINIILFFDDSQFINKLLLLLGNLDENYKCTIRAQMLTDNPLNQIRAFNR